MYFSMSKEKPSRAYLAVKRLVRAVYPKMEVVGRENLPDQDVVIVGNHAQLHGPIACELYMGDDRYTWCAGQMMNLKEVPAYAYQDFWSMKPAALRWIYKGLSYLIAPLSVFVFNNANTIPVYHDARLLTTFRETLEKLANGARIVIFPERNQPYNGLLWDFQDRFIDLAQMYYTKTGRELCFVPLYVAPKLKKLVLGEPIRYHCDVPLAEERDRICIALMKAITDLARSLPRHIVIPYPNLPKSQYPVNLPDEL